MNSSAEESLMALLEAMLQLASREARRTPKPKLQPGGFPEELFLDLKDEDEKEELSCGICYQILKEAMQCGNNHKFCHSCLVVWSTTGMYANRVKCPVCRTQGIYFRNDEIDDRIGNKKVKCQLESCTWTGLAKYLTSHRHNTYGGSDTPNSEQAHPSSSVTPIPRLAQASPRMPARSTARFAGTGLTTRDSQEQNGHVRGSLLNSHNTSRASPASTSSTGQEVIIDLTAGRNTGGTGASRALGPASRNAVPPVRRAANNRITFSHSNPTTDNNNNVSGSPVSNSPVRSSMSNTSASSEGVPNTFAAGHTPRPPSAPRTSSNVINARRLPRIVNAPGQRSQGSRMNASQRAGGVRASGAATNLGEIRDSLHESRSRLDNLMSSFSGELDRNRQEMADFNREREQQRREQLEEVRELGQRLGQVASELRRLLEHRRPMHLALSSSDDDDDDDDDDE